MGKKYIIEINDEDRVVDGHIRIPFELSVEGLPGKVGFSYTIENKLIPYTEPDTEAAYAHGYSNAEIKYRAEVKEAYQKGLSDAWDAARKIVDCAIPYEALENYLEIGECTADVIKHLPASKAIEVVRQYEQKQNEIRVGDEVEGDEDGQRGVVIDSRFENSQVAVLTGNSKVYSWWSKCAIHKTGRHFPEIAEVLEKMRKSE